MPKRTACRRQFVTREPGSCLRELRIHTYMSVARHGTAMNTAREIRQSGPCPTLARSDRPVAEGGLEHAMGWALESSLNGGSELRSRRCKPFAYFGADRFLQRSIQ